MFLFLSNGQGTALVIHVAYLDLSIPSRFRIREAGKGHPPEAWEDPFASWYGVWYSVHLVEKGSDFKRELLFERTCMSTRGLGWGGVLLLEPYQ